MQPQEILKKYFGYDSFRHRQREAVDNILSGRDVLCVMPTGAGKSLCYQVPAMAMDGVSIIISPLISLMKDQVMSLNKNGIPAAYLNSSLTVNQYLKALDYMKQGRYKIVYVAPERLLTPSFLSACREIDISQVAVDEAHCVSRWGQDFRPGYLKIPQFISRLKIRPVVAAFTATATGQVKEDICRLLELDAPYCVTTGFDRPNLSFSVLRPKDKYRALLNILKSHRDDSGIVYCSTRNRVDTLYDNLSAAGYSCGKYHAGLGAEERKTFQDRFIFDEVKIMIATNAFGMGIDKSNVGYVVHYNMPKNIESYYQEAGRAGRDGRKAECILLYAPKDVITNKFLIENSRPNEELTIQQRRQVRERELEKLKYMTFYCTTDRCLRQFILEYFGQKSGGYCGNCSNCLTEFEQEDITGRARKVIMCISQLPVPFGLSVAADVLKGNESEMVEKWRLANNDYFGSMAGLSLAKIKDILRYLILRGYIDQTADRYPTVNVSARGERLMSEGTKVLMRVKKSEKTAPATAAPMPPADRGLLAELKALRLDIAKKERVPAYVIFTDATLNEMAARKPKTLQEMSRVKGIGSRKLSAYGEKFLRLINEKTEPVAETPASKAEPAVEAPPPEADRSLLAELKALRLSIAKEERLPAYFIFTDATLNEMAARKPRTLQEMSRVKGVGSRKLSAYGEKFLRLINEKTEPVAETPASKAEPAVEAPTPEADRSLLAELKALRLSIAKEERLPAYFIFTDATLNEMAARKPKTLQEMSQIKGVGIRKLFTYGEKFLRLLNEKTDSV